MEEFYAHTVTILLAMITAAVGHCCRPLVKHIGDGHTAKGGDVEMAEW